MTKGVQLIAEERQRQIEKEGWSQERDIREHPNGELAIAGACYALPKKNRAMRSIHEFMGYDYGDRGYRSGPRIIATIPARWPWHHDWWKPTPDDRIRELQKGGALIAAEIDRLLAIEDKQACKIIDELNASGVSYGIDPGDGTMYFHTEADKEKGEAIIRRIEGDES